MAYWKNLWMLAGQSPASLKDIFYRRGERAGGLTDEQAQAGAERLSQAGLPVEIVPESKLPQHLQRDLASRGLEGKVRGLYDKKNDRIYAVQENLHSQDELFFVAFHEAFHRGLRKTFGPEVQPILNVIYTGNERVRRAVKSFMDAHGVDRNEAIEEVLADMAGRADVRDLTGWDKLVAFLKNAIAKLAKAVGAKIEVTDDMVRDFVAGVRKAGADPVHMMTAEDTAFSRVQAWPELSDALRDYEESGSKFTTVNDVADELESLLADDRAPRALQSALDTFREEQRDDRELGGRGDMDRAGEALLSAIEREVGPAFSRAEADPRDASTFAAKARDTFNDFASTSKTFNWWNKTVGTQYQKAEQDKHFKRVFDATQDYLSDISRLANDSADRARDLLPRLENLKDVFKDTLFDKNPTREKDVKAIAKPIFQGTLADLREYKAEELKRVFGLDDKQVDLYKQFRSAVNKSLDDLTTSTAAKILRNVGFLPDMIREELEAGDHQGLAKLAAEAAQVDPN
jgi:hypothetical protein